MKMNTSKVKSVNSYNLGTIFIFTLVMFMGLSLLQAVSVEAQEEPKIWYVDGTSGTDDGTHGTRPGADAFKTIQYAINDSRVVDGDTINVAAGTYNEQVVIDNKANLTITGASKETTTIKGGEHKTEEPWIVGILNTTGIKLSDFTIETNVSGLYYGLKLYNASNCGISDLEIKNIQPTSYYNPKGIELLSSSKNNKFSDVDIENIISPSNMAYGVYVDSGCNNNTFDRLNISNVTSTYSAYGFWVEGANENSLTDSEISDISGQYTCGVYLEDAEGSTIARNDISSISGGSYGAFGIMLNILNAGGGSNHNTIEGNTISGLGTGEENTSGIYLGGSSNNTIKGNNISDADVGIRIEKVTKTFPSTLSQESANNTVENCTITGNTSGVSVSDSSDNKIHLSKISGNTEYGVTAANVEEVDATCNWWGDKSGPKHASNPSGAGDAVSDNVLYYPWYTDATLTTLSNFITLTKTGPANAKQGDVITYTIEYKNEGNFPETNVVITETYPPEVDFVSSIPAPDAGTNNKWTIGDLASEAEGTITITVRIK